MYEKGGFFIYLGCLGYLNQWAKRKSHAIASRPVPLTQTVQSRKTWDCSHKQKVCVTFFLCNPGITAHQKHEQIQKYPTCMFDTKTG